jgi:hypothetical protein
VVRDKGDKGDKGDKEDTEDTEDTEDKGDTGEKINFSVALIVSTQPWIKKLRL